MAAVNKNPENNADVQRLYDELLEVLGVALDFRDNETAGHSRRVSRFSSEIARAMGCSSEELVEINRGAYLHDLGKIAIPDAILFKKGRLSPEEWEVMRTHAWIGYNLLSRISLLTRAAEVLLTHHERYDGTGYPRGLKGEEIPLAARIFAIADTLDAMTSDRPYRRALPFTTACEEIKGQAGCQFDPEVVRVFLSIPEDKLRAVLLEEKRRTVRLKIDADVICTLEGKEHHLKCSDLSVGGMLLENANGLRVGAQLELRFALPGVASPLTVNAKAVRRELPNRAAVAFLALSPEYRQAIQGYIADRVQQV